MIKSLIGPHLKIPFNSATTGHIPVLYPWHADAGLGNEGIYIGENAYTGQAWCWDPFVLYERDVIKSPNVAVLGKIGYGKSTAVKTMVYRSALLGNGKQAGRWVAIVDPKGEYEPLVEALDLRHIRLYPGGKSRLNPLDPGPIPAGTQELVVRRSEMVGALAATVLRRDLSAAEESSLSSTLQTLTESEQSGKIGTATLVDLLNLLHSPPAHLVSSMCFESVQDFCDHSMDLRLGLEALTKGRLAGMFDGPSTESSDWSGRGVVIDVSSVFHNQQAFELVMIAATGWLQSLLAIEEGPMVPRRIQVLEEIWALLGSTQVAKYYQSSQKLSRQYGVCNIAVVHKLSDLTAQAAAGSVAQKVASGIISDTETRIFFHQDHTEVEKLQSFLGMNRVQTRQLTSLRKGQALWNVGEIAAVVNHRVSDLEQTICWTDAAMQI